MIDWFTPSCRVCGKKDLTTEEVIRLGSERECCCWECIKWWAVVNDAYGARDAH